MDQEVTKPAWKAMHQSYTETRKGALGINGRRDPPGPFPHGQRTTVAA